MQYDADFVEYIVREVIRRLSADGHLAARTEVTSALAPRELVIRERLVTLATLAGQLDGLARITVGRRAVVTPAVRDELKQRKIELKREF